MGNDYKSMSKFKLNLSNNNIVITHTLYEIIKVSNYWKTFIALGHI